MSEEQGNVTPQRALPSAGDTGPMLPFYMVFDVESIGLHGQDFAVGWTVVDRKGDEYAHGMHVAWVAWENIAKGRSDRDRESVAWLRANLPAHLVKQDDSLPGRHQVHNEFWREWLHWKEKGATLWADCGWPVEARFLIACVDESLARTWEGPYPMHEIATMLTAAGMDPLATYPRTGREMPKHDPLADARQSARLLIEALDRLAFPTKDALGGARRQTNATDHPGRTRPSQSPPSDNGRDGEGPPEDLRRDVAGVSDPLHSPRRAHPSADEAWTTE